MSTGKTYSTFVDNISYTSSCYDDNKHSMSRKSSTASLQPQKGHVPSTLSTASIQRHYSKPVLVPTATSPLHNRENFVAGTGNYSSSYAGVIFWRIGTACCPCMGSWSGSSAESGGLWQGIIRFFFKKSTPTEGQQLIKRTKSEEEILKKRPKRTIVAKSNQDLVSLKESVDTNADHTDKMSTVPDQTVVVSQTETDDNGKEITSPPKASKANENSVAKPRVRPEAKFIREERRSHSMTRLTGISNENFDQWSNKSASPSPIIGGARIPHGVIAARDLVRDFRESSVNSRSSADSFGIETDFREDSIPRDDSTRQASPFSRQQQHGGSTTSLGSRSESMLSIHSQEGGRYGTVTVRGEVEFGMAYSIHSGSLDLAVKQCRDLAAVDSKRNRSDPYVKVYLLPDKSKSGKRKTKVKKHSINPIFDEVLKFQMPLDEVARRTLWVSVWHSDMFGRNDFLGEVMLPLSGQPLDDPSPKWYSLSDRTEPLGDELSQGLVTYRGELIVALKFIPPGADPISSSTRKLSGSNLRRNSTSKRGSLLVLVKEAKNLVAAKGSGLPDPFVKCYLLPTSDRPNKQKTPVCRRTVTPRWEYTLRWEDVTISDLINSSLELTVWDQDRVPGRHNECLGGARFNLGTGKYQGRPVAWMDSGEKEVTLWQQMLDRPNFWVEGSVHLRAPEKLNTSQSLQN